MRRALVTGALGFVGRTFCEALAQSGYVVRAALRTECPTPACISEKVVVGDIATITDWRAPLRNVDVVVHLAARAHVLHDSSANSNLYVATNVRGTECLAEESARAEVRRFVYLSSVKVNGEETTGDAYTADDEPDPQDAYGASKRLAEQCVRAVAQRTRMEAVVVRSPLVYGPGVRANFLRLLRWVDRQWPIPLGAVLNARSIVGVWNLSDLLVRVLGHPAASGTWMVSDGEDLSTPELMERIGRAMHRPVRLVSVPVGVLKGVGRLIGRKAEMARLCGSLTVNIDKTRRELGWSPPMTVDEGLARTVTWYRSDTRRR
jgi:UDP-4-keto-D-QuiNAc 4-reductase